MTRLGNDDLRFGEWSAEVHDHLATFLHGLATSSADSRLPSPPAAAAYEPPAGPEPLEDLLARVERVASDAVETSGPRYFAYFPAGGLPSAALGELTSLVLNRYTGVTSMAPSLARLEQSLVDWMCREVGLPSGSGGLLTTGASLATLTALHTAREARLSGPDRDAVVYVTAYTHLCVAKAARIAGFAPDQVRVVPHDAGLRMDVDAARAMVREDADAGRRPFLVVGTGGSTSTGTVDPLEEMADLAAEHGLWFHVDAAYGGGFVLTERGRRVLVGAERADSFAFDPHKSLFMPYGTGVLLVRSRADLVAAHAADGDYLQDLDDLEDLPDVSDLGPELTREYRALRLLFPLHLHGVDAFRSALDDTLDLAAWLHAELAADERLVVGAAPDLTVVTFASVDGDEATRELVRRINEDRRVFVSSTRVEGRYSARACVLSHRTREADVHELASTVRAAASV